MKWIGLFWRALVALASFLTALVDYLIEILEEMGSPKRRRPRR
jgi:hypothetical protein|tara:strand:- start:546 stop:674 length:129 start_codon:yes stop_codon:yes gene_type:complete